jgi:hypothetical protein
LAPILGGVMLLDLIAFAWGVTPQTDPALYYPRVPILEQIAAAPPGRILCMSCLPPRLNETHDLDDVRGYDGVQPARLLGLLELTRDDRFATPDYAQTQLYVPHFEGHGREIRFAPVLDLLGVRYAIFRGNAPAGLSPAFEAPDYWALENPRALPRAFVPARAQTLDDEQHLLWEMAREEFAPAEVAYVDGPVEWNGAAKGNARILDETPNRVELDVSMETPGVVVLADLWDPGWRATVNGRAAPVLRADHALRAVEVPAGPSEVVFRYAPTSPDLEVNNSTNVPGLLALGVGDETGAVGGGRAGARREAQPARVEGPPLFVDRKQSRKRGAAIAVLYDQGLLAGAEDPLVGPEPERGHHDPQVAPLGRQLVCVAVAALVEGLSLEDPVGDETLKTIRENVARDAQLLLELVEAPRTEEGLADDQQRPPVPDLLERLGDAAVHVVEPLARHGSSLDQFELHYKTQKDRVSDTARIAVPCRCAHGRAHWRIR